MEDSINDNDQLNNYFENITIKDKNYRMKQIRKKIIIITIIFAFLILIAAGIVVYIKLNELTYGEITCVYKTTKDNQNIELIKNNGKLKYFLKIDGEEFSQSTSHTFKTSGFHNVTFIFKRRVYSLDNLFENMEALIEADLSKLDAEELTSINYLFLRCLNLIKVKFDFNTSNKIERMVKTFSRCKSLTSVTFNFTAEKLKDITGIFQYCESLTDIKPDIFNTTNLQIIDDMFTNNSKLSYLDLSHLNFEKLTSMNSTFFDCENLIDIIFPKSYTNELVYASATFWHCFSLENIDLTFLRTDKVKFMGYLFDGCHKVKQLDMAHFRTNNLIFVGGMFKNCKSLTSIDLSNFNFEKVESFGELFEGCQSLEEINLSYINAPLLNSMTNTFKDCKNLKQILLPRNLGGIKYLTQAFSNCEKLENIDLSPLYGIQNLEYINSMFHNCTSLKSVEFPNINATGLYSTSNMFYNCSNLKSINMGNFLTSINLYNLENMFYGCINLNYLDISKLYINNNCNIKDIFHGVISNITIKVYKNVNQDLKAQILNLTNLDDIVYEL